MQAPRSSACYSAWAYREIRYSGVWLCLQAILLFFVYAGYRISGSISSALRTSAAIVRETNKYSAVGSAQQCRLKQLFKPHSASPPSAVGYSVYFLRLCSFCFPSYLFIYVSLSFSSFIYVSLSLSLSLDLGLLRSKEETNMDLHTEFDSDDIQISSKFVYSNMQLPRVSADLNYISRYIAVSNEP
jgi:hypothetical protein